MHFFLFLCKSLVIWQKGTIFAPEFRLESNPIKTPRYVKPLLLLLPLIASMACTSHPTPPEAPAIEEDTLTIPAPPQTITLFFAGDLMQHQPQFEAARCKDGSFDYTGCFDEVRDQIEAADVAIANLETTLGASNFRGYPCFCSPDAYAAAIKEAGFDILLTCNNHSCDSRLKGICRTISALDSLQIPHLGTYVDSVARENQYPYLLEAKGFRIALLAYTYGTNGLPIPTPTIVNKIDTVQMEIDIAKAKRMQPDAIIAFMHWGYEHHLKPNKEQQFLADWLLKQGVTHVIGGHPHVVQPIELRTDTLTNDKHLVVYSLGNYISHMVKQNCTGGMTVTLTLERDSLGQCRTKGADYSLIFVDRPAHSHQRVHRVLPISYPDSLLSPAARAHRDIFLSNAEKVFQECNVGI